jgi:hypothetical protein
MTAAALLVIDAAAGAAQKKRLERKIKLLINTNFTTGLVYMGLIWCQAGGGAAWAVKEGKREKEICRKIGRRGCAEHPPGGLVS